MVRQAGRQGQAVSSQGKDAPVLDVHLHGFKALVLRLLLSHKLCLAVLAWLRPQVAAQPRLAQPARQHEM